MKNRDQVEWRLSVFSAGKSDLTTEGTGDTGENTENCTREAETP